MNPTTLPLTAGKILIDNSTLQEICACPRKAYYKLILKRQLVKPRAALFFGGAIHRALETRDRCQTIICDLATEEAMINSLVDEYHGVDLDNDYRNLDYAIQTIQKYNIAFKCDPHPPISIPTASGEPKLAVELPFALTIGQLRSTQPILCSDALDPSREPWFQSEFDLVFTGKIDRICEHNGVVHLLDHKTTSIGGTTFFDEFFTSLQFRGYKLATEHITKKPVSGVIINALMCRPPLKSGGVNYTFDRQIIPIDNSLVDEWKTTFFTIAQNWLSLVQRFQTSSDPTVFPLHTNSCVTKYGRCEYFDICQLPISHRHSMISSWLFEDHSWSPLEDSAKPKPKPEVNLDGLF